MSDKIQVAIKVRPLVAREAEVGEFWRVEGNELHQLNADGLATGEKFTFDHVFGKLTNNLQVFEEVVKPLVDRAVKGFNATIFAYGQTSSGKTHTMLGNSIEAGVTQLAVSAMFDFMKKSEGREFLVRASYMEIYNEKVNDLLEQTNHNLKIREEDGRIVVNRLKEELVADTAKVMNLLKRGHKIRRIGETNLNEKSSRSHTIFRLIIESRLTDRSTDGTIQVSQLNLVDLAGSERCGPAGTTGDRLKEGCAINRSLFQLGQVVSQLSEGREFVNFRDSKLTRILQSSLGGNAHTLIICTITPASLDFTSSTLGFASRAKSVKNKPQVNEVMSDGTLIKKYARQLEKLQAELKAVKERSTANELESKLEEQARINSELQQRINNLMKTLIVAERAPKSRLNRRRTWGGQMNLDLPKGRVSMLGTIQEVDTSLVLSHDVFNTPYEDFEVQLIEDEREKCSELDLATNSESSLNYFDMSSLDLSLNTNRTSVSKNFSLSPTNETSTDEIQTSPTSVQTSPRIEETETPLTVLRSRNIHWKNEACELESFLNHETELTSEGENQEIEKDKNKLQELEKHNYDLEMQIQELKTQNKICNEQVAAFKENLCKEVVSLNSHYKNKILEKNEPGEIINILMKCIMEKQVEIISQFKSQADSAERNADQGRNVLEMEINQLHTMLKQLREENLEQGTKLECLQEANHELEFQVEQLKVKSRELASENELMCLLEKKVEDLECILNKTEKDLRSERVKNEDLQKSFYDMESELVESKKKFIQLEELNYSLTKKMQIDSEELKVLIQNMADLDNELKKELSQKEELQKENQYLQEKICFQEQKLLDLHSEAKCLGHEAIETLTAREEVQHHLESVEKLKAEYEMRLSKDSEEKLALKLKVEELKNSCLELEATCKYLEESKLNFEREIERKNEGNCLEEALKNLRVQYIEEKKSKENMENRLHVVENELAKYKKECEQAIEKSSNFIPNQSLTDDKSTETRKVEDTKDEVNRNNLEIILKNLQTKLAITEEKLQNYEEKEKVLQNQVQNDMVLKEEMQSQFLNLEYLKNECEMNLQKEKEKSLSLQLQVDELNIVKTSLERNIVFLQQSKRDLENVLLERNEYSVNKMLNHDVGEGKSEETLKSFDNLQIESSLMKSQYWKEDISKTGLEFRDASTQCLSYNYSMSNGNESEKKLRIESVNRDSLCELAFENGVGKTKLHESSLLLQEQSQKLSLSNELLLRHIDDIEELKSVGETLEKKMQLRTSLQSNVEEIQNVIELQQYLDDVQKSKVHLEEQISAKIDQEENIQCESTENGNGLRPNACEMKVHSTSHILMMELQNEEAAVENQCMLWKNQYLEEIEKLNEGKLELEQKLDKELQNKKEMEIELQNLYLKLEEQGQQLSYLLQEANILKNELKCDVKEFDGVSNTDSNTDSKDMQQMTIKDEYYSLEDQSVKHMLQANVFEHERTINEQKKAITEIQNYLCTVEDELNEKRVLLLELPELKAKMQEYDIMERCVQKEDEQCRVTTEIIRRDYECQLQNIFEEKNTLNENIDKMKKELCKTKKLLEELENYKYEKEKFILKLEEALQAKIISLEGINCELEEKIKENTKRQSEQDVELQEVRKLLIEQESKITSFITNINVLEDALIKETMQKEKLQSQLEDIMKCQVRDQQLEEKHPLGFETSQQLELNTGCQLTSPGDLGESITDVAYDHDNTHSELNAEANENDIRMILEELILQLPNHGTALEENQRLKFEDLESIKEQLEEKLKLETEDLKYQRKFECEKESVQIQEQLIDKEKKLSMFTENVDILENKIKEDSLLKEYMQFQIETLEREKVDSEAMIQKALEEKAALEAKLKEQSELIKINENAKHLEQRINLDEMKLYGENFIIDAGHEECIKHLEEKLKIDTESKSACQDELAKVREKLLEQEQKVSDFVENLGALEKELNQGTLLKKEMQSQIEELGKGKMECEAALQKAMEEKDALSAKLEQQEKLVKDIEEARSTLQLHVSNAQLELQEKRKLVLDLEDEKNELLMQIKYLKENFEVKIKELEEHSEVLQEKVKVESKLKCEYEVELTCTQNKLTEQEDKFFALTENFKVLEDEFKQESLQKENMQHRIEKLEKDKVECDLNIQEILEDKLVLEARLEELIQKIKEIEEERLALQLHADCTESELKDKKVKILEIMEQKKDVEVRYRHLEETLISEVQTLKYQKNELEAKLKQETDRVIGLQTEISCAKEQLSAVDEKLKIINEKADYTEKDLTKFKEIKKQLKVRIKDLENLNIEYENKFQKMVLKKEILEKELEEQVNDLKTHKASFKQSVNKFDRDLKEKENIINELKKEKSYLGDIKANLEAKIDTLVVEKFDLQETLNMTTQREREKEIELTHMRNKLCDQERMFDNLLEEAKNLEEQIKEETVTNVELMKQLGSLQEHKSNLEKLLQKEIEEKKVIDSKFSELSNKCVEQEKIIKYLASTKESLEKQLNEQEAKMQEQNVIEDVKKENEQYHETENVIGKHYESKLKNWLEEKNALEENLDKTRKELYETKTLLAELENRKSEQEKFILDLEEKSQAKIRSLEQIKCDLEEKLKENFKRVNDQEIQFSKLQKILLEKKSKLSSSSTNTEVLEDSLIQERMRTEKKQQQLENSKMCEIREKEFGEGEREIELETSTQVECHSRSRLPFASESEKEMELAHKPVFNQINYYALKETNKSLKMQHLEDIRSKESIKGDVMRQEAELAQCKMQIQDLNNQIASMEFNNKIFRNRIKDLEEEKKEAKEKLNLKCNYAAKLEYDVKILQKQLSEVEQLQEKVHRLNDQTKEDSIMKQELQSRVKVLEKQKWENEMKYFLKEGDESLQLQLQLQLKVNGLVERTAQHDAAVKEFDKSKADLTQMMHSLERRVSLEDSENLKDVVSELNRVKNLCQEYEKKIQEMNEEKEHFVFEMARLNHYKREYENRIIELEVINRSQSQELQSKSSSSFQNDSLNMSVQNMRMQLIKEAEANAALENHLHGVKNELAQAKKLIRDLQRIPNKGSNSDQHLMAACECLNNEVKAKENEIEAQNAVLKHLFLYFQHILQPQQSHIQKLQNIILYLETNGLSDNSVSKAEYQNEKEALQKRIAELEKRATFLQDKLTEEGYVYQSPYWIRRGVSNQKMRMLQMRVTELEEEVKQLRGSDPEASNAALLDDTLFQFLKSPPKPPGCLKCEELKKDIASLREEAAMKGLKIKGLQSKLESKNFEYKEIAEDWQKKVYGMKLENKRLQNALHSHEEEFKRRAMRRHQETQTPKDPVFWDGLRSQGTGSKIVDERIIEDQRKMIMKLTNDKSCLKQMVREMRAVIEGGSKKSQLTSQALPVPSPRRKAALERLVRDASATSEERKRPWPCSWRQDDKENPPPLAEAKENRNVDVHPKKQDNC